MMVRKSYEAATSVFVVTRLPSKIRDIWYGLKTRFETRLRHILFCIGKDEPFEPMLNSSSETFM